MIKENIHLIARHNRVLLVSDGTFKWQRKVNET